MVPCGAAGSAPGGPFPSVAGTAAWGDYDSDGDLDILLTGFDSNFTHTAQVYRNDGGNTFTDINANLTAVGHSSVAWGDYDSDGDLDILLTGFDSSLTTPIAQVYRNGGNSFTDINANLTGVGYSSAAWGDSDNDGDLDILIAGSTLNYGSGYFPTTKLYRNNASAAAAGVNITPVAGLTTTEAGGTATFSVALRTQPAADVTVTFASSNTAEGTAPVSITFTPGNWNVAQTVTIAGVDDFLDDGDVAYTIVTAVQSADPQYAAIDPAEVQVTNIDNDSAGVTITPTSGLMTTGTWPRQ